MQTVLIVVHLMIVLALVVVVLLQKSEGGALGIGGGGGFMAGRSAANPLSRLTGVYPFPSSDHRTVWVDLSVRR